VLRETVKSLKMDSDDIVPPEWELNARFGQMAGMVGPDGAPLPGGGGGGPAPGQDISEKPVSGEPHEQPIGGAPPVIPIEQMANM